MSTNRAGSSGSAQSLEPLPDGCANALQHTHDWHHTASEGDGSRDSVRGDPGPLEAVKHDVLPRGDRGELPPQLA
ncbi:MAG: hypothetical protein IT379_02345 [Deltaproteobacteria bacterium]|nr:hypothetical protein [Deltaproteobacteria bacterium]